MHCWDSNQEPLLSYIIHKKKKNALQGFKPGNSRISGIRRHCSNLYTIHHRKTSSKFLQKMTFIKISVLYSWRLLALACNMRSGYAESCVVARVCKTTRNASRGSSAGNSLLLYAIPVSVWPPNSLLNKFRRLFHQNETHCSSSCGYPGKPKSLAS